MMNKMESMGGGAQELPPGYTEAVRSNDKLDAAGQSAVIERLSELNKATLEAKRAGLNEVAAKMLREGGGKLPSEAPAVSDMEKKLNFIRAVAEVCGTTDKAEVPASDFKKDFDKAMKEQEQWPPEYKDAVIRIAGEFNDRLRAAKESEWKAKTSEAVRSSNGKLTAMDNSISVEDKQKHIVLAVKKVAQMMREDNLKSQEAERVADKEKFRDTDNFAA